MSTLHAPLACLRVTDIETHQHHGINDDGDDDLVNKHNMGNRCAFCVLAPVTLLWAVNSEI